MNPIVAIVPQIRESYVNRADLECADFGGALAGILFCFIRRFHPKRRRCRRTPNLSSHAYGTDCGIAVGAHL
jgi:hypothetical protein